MTELLAEKTIVTEISMEPGKKWSWNQDGVFGRTSAVYLGLDDRGKYVGFVQAFLYGSRNSDGTYSCLEVTWNAYGNSGRMGIDEYMLALGPEAMLLGDCKDMPSARSRVPARLVRTGEGAYKHETFLEERE